MERLGPYVSRLCVRIVGLGRNTLSNAFPLIVRNDILALVKDQLLFQQYQQRQQERLYERLASESPRKKRKVDVSSSNSDVEEIEELPSPPSGERNAPAKAKGKGKRLAPATHFASSSSANASGAPNQSGVGNGRSVDHVEVGQGEAKIVDNTMRIRF